MRENQKSIILRRFMIVIGIALTGLCAIVIAFYWYLALVSGYAGSTPADPVIAAKTLQSFRDLEEARAQSKDITSLPLTTQKNIIVLEPSTWVWEKSKAMGGSALQVKVETGKYKGMVVWIRAKDVFIGGAVL